MKKCLIPAVLLVLALLAGCQETEQPFVVPVGEEVSNTSAFEVTVPEGKRVVLYVERWQGKDCVEQKCLVSLNQDTKPVVLQVNEMDGQLQYLYLTQAGDVQEVAEWVQMEAPSPALYTWCWLTLEEVEMLSAEGMPSELILYAQGMSTEGSVPSLACNNLLEDMSFAEQYTELQLVRAVLEEA